LNITPFFGETVVFISSLKMEVKASYETFVTSHQMPTVARESNKNYTRKNNQNNGKLFGFFSIHGDMINIGATSYRDSIIHYCEKQTFEGKKSSGVQEIPYISLNPKPHQHTHKNTLFQAK
jgi:hypothetical protein